MNATAVIIAGLVVAGIIVYLILARREEIKTANSLRNVNKQLWEKVITQKQIADADAARVRAELDALNKLDHEARTKAVIDRMRKDQEPK